mmetsp:Transcript_17811/g.28831  ORF Transcript_17811/g.28831 Transcript_17811/m.28831 type:complete len:560 (+) Transcript_17811:438-2117(+)
MMATSKGGEDFVFSLEGRIVSGSGNLQEKVLQKQKDMLCSGNTWNTAFMELKQANIAKIHHERDRSGRRIVFLFACNLLPILEDDFEKSLMYTLFILQAVSHEPYCIVHVHEGMNDVSSKYFTWLQKLYKLLPKAYLEHIRKIYILTTSRTLRSIIWLARPFTNTKLWKKIEYVHSKKKLVKKLGCDFVAPRSGFGSASNSSETDQSGLIENDASTFASTTEEKGVSSPLVNTAQRRRSYHVTSIDKAEGDKNRQDMDELANKRKSCRPRLSVYSKQFNESDQLSEVHVAHQQKQVSESEIVDCVLVHDLVQKDVTIISPAGRDGSRSQATAPLQMLKSSGVFGVPLSLQLESCHMPLPPVIVECIDYILKYGKDLTGLFRIPGDGQDVINYKKAYNRGEHDLFPKQSGHVHTVGSLLKAYFRDLPTPIVPEDMYKQVTKLGDQPCDDSSTMAYHLGDVMMSMPAQNFNVIGYLVHFLGYIARNWSEGTGMSAQNLAIVWAPTILVRTRAVSEHASMDQCHAFDELVQLPNCIRALRCMIEHPEIVFPKEMIAYVPSFV